MDKGIDPVALKNQEYGAFISIGGVAMHLAHTAVDYEKVLRLGLEGIKEQIAEELKKPADDDKRTYLEGAVIAMNAVVAFANRYAELAKEKAAIEENPARRMELESIAETCRWVPAYPARNFHEAIQSMWFVHLGLRMEAPALGITLGRPDQFLYPFYLKDIEQGIITKEQALEELALLFVKMNDMAVVMGAEQVESLGGFPTMAGITIGGVTPEGENAVNELSYLILEAEQMVGLTVDEVIIRVADKTPLRFIEEACRANKRMRGKLKFVGDRTAIEQFTSYGRPIEMARDYILAGCFTPTIPYRCFDTSASTINVLFLLELALNDGVSRITGEQVGPKTGDPRKFKSMDDVLAAFRTQFDTALSHGIRLHDQYKEQYTKYVPQPFQSILFDGCIETGKDFADGLLTGIYAREQHGIAGLINVGDSLAGLKKAVFDEKIVTMEEMIDALDKNFDGYDELLYILRHAPKFGNDIEYVDDLTNMVLDICQDVIKQYTGYKGATSVLCASTGTANMDLGRKVGATPEGRKAGEALAEGGVSPHQGRNKTGITATFNSVARLHHTAIPGGSVFNMRINPDVLKDDEKVHKFAVMLKTFFENGGFHAQFNTVDGEMLKDAQRNPEKYKDLVVRVATYSALFTELSKSLQDNIIERTEFGSL